MSTPNIPKGEQRLFTIEQLNLIEEQLDKEVEDFRLIGLDNKPYRVPNPCFGERKYVSPPAMAYASKGKQPTPRFERHNAVRFGSERGLERSAQRGERDSYLVVRPEPLLKTVSQYSTDQVKEELRLTIESWEASEKCRNLIRAIESVAMPNIEQIIAFGLGTVSARANRTIHQREHALALTIARTLEKKDPSRKISIHLQDPDYTYVCRAALQHMGFYLIDGHGARGFTKIDERTLVMSHNAPIPIREVVADIARPAAMYWKPEIPQEEHDRNPQLANTMMDMDSVRTRRMMTEYDFVPIPGASLSQHSYYDYSRHRGQGKDGEPFGNSVLYVRKPAYASQPFQP